jgi:hypothetical protein
MSQSFQSTPRTGATKAFVQCPICAGNHEIIVITVRQRPDFEAEHLAHFRCTAIDAQKSARLEVWPAAATKAREAAP